ncbi:hypothetical protein TRFO_30886 [Tritrichomonas foetus]|uniref:sn-1-specific diacylglycerol lipase n=1 Tax=Tritrichomonas foetus TaxID=1144522 RepID=A0A1J4JSL2_9EUKA|nr:hypothetical protein TRFO_30886 [Tritrichomonas foetus]|eukprot:OHT02127.1 hypothetical protein TRFO_30886 [Tritrichomonas foetus]
MARAVKKYIKKIRPHRRGPQQKADAKSFAFLLKILFELLPASDQLDSTEIPRNEILEMLHCCLLCRNIYKKEAKRYLPPNLSNIVYESQESDYFIIPYFIVNSDELDTIFVVFRGSYCLKDFIVDFMASTVSYRNGKAHEGIYLTSYNMFNRIKKRVRKLSRMNNNRKVIITGHSLGAAVASMVVDMFYEEDERKSENSSQTSFTTDYSADDQVNHENFESDEDLESSENLEYRIEDEEHLFFDLKCICFAPVASYSRENLEATKLHTRSYSTDGDFVPHVSFYNAISISDDQLPALFKKELDKAIRKKLNIHGDKFEPTVSQILENRVEYLTNPYPLYPPGDCYQIKMTDEHHSTIELMKIDDSTEYFGKFVKDLNEFRHMISCYNAWVIKYFVDNFQDQPDLIEYYDFMAKKKKQRKEIAEAPEYEEEYVD